MRTTACIRILVLFRLYASAGTYDSADLNPPNVPNNPDGKKGSKICFIDHKPFNCSKLGQIANNAHSESLGHQASSPGILSTIKGNSDNVIGSLPLRIRYHPPKYAQSSSLYPPNVKIQGRLYDSRPSQHEKHNHYVTNEHSTVISHSSDDLVSPSRDHVDDGRRSASAAVSLFAAQSRPLKRGKNLLDDALFDKFTQSLDQFERKFYQTAFNKLLSISPPSRSENGISFVQSGLFLYLALMALSTETDPISSAEIEDNLQLHLSNSEKIKLIQQIVSWLPTSNNNLKFRWATRLVLEPRLPVSQEFKENTASAFKIEIDWLNGTEMANLTSMLNNRVKTDSGGAMRNTFEEEEFADGACSILLNTMYVRSRWRSPPTVLNGLRPFHDSKQAPHRSVQMIRINDIMRYALLKEWQAEALEISYATPNLTLLLLVPQKFTLKSLAMNMATTSLRTIDTKMRTMRIAATLPIYTLRMTLLLPGKLKTMGISRLVDTSHRSSTGCGELKLSHAVQRLMFWAEAGRNAYKDDGIEWDEAPEREMLVDRPYLFYVRWKNVTLMNGNFVL